MPRWFLKSVDISGGFLAGLSLTFPRGLTCIIGPRGSGKTTLAEAVRFAMAGSGGLSVAGQKLMASNLSPSVVVLKTASEGGGLGYVVTRSGRNVANLTTSDGVLVSAVDLDRRTFLPLDGYSSTEIENIADETEGDKRRSLLDELRWDEIQAINYDLAEQRRLLDANADNVKRTRDLIGDLTERMEELGGARSRLAALPKPEKEEETQDLVRAAEQHQLNEQELQALDDRSGIIANVASEIAELSERMNTTLSQPMVVEASANAAHVRKADFAVISAVETSRRLLGEVAAKLQTAHKTIAEVRTQLLSVHEEQNSVFVQLQEKNAAATQAVQERAAAEQAVAKLVGLEAEKKVAVDRLEKALQQRQELRGAYLLKREEIAKVREEVAQLLQTEIGNHVRIQVRRGADSIRYQQFLSEGLKGARVRNHEDILSGLLRLRPDQLAQIIQDKDFDEFEQQLSLGEERSRKVLESFIDQLDPLELELVGADDKILIELNVGTAAEPNFKDASGLSRGQKCTSLLPLLLAQRDTPLIIDQPEDNLDNRFIFETVVEAVRRLKEHRQMVFITHNANIPVLAEADQIVVLNSDGKVGFVQKMGSLDECRSEIIDLLEGGEEAFDLRRARYGRA